MTDGLQVILDIVIGLAIGFAVSFYAYKKQSLAFSGMIASIVIGVIIFVTGGWLFTAVILTFFISSSLLSKLLHKEEEKDSLRTYKQVFANGLIATVLSILYAIFQDDIFTLLFAISIAVSTADTWASEIGRLSPQKPRHILTWNNVETGRSGGVTWFGFVASLLGSLLISSFFGFQIQIILWGFLGSVVDSLLGTMQIRYVTKDGIAFDEPSPTEGFVRTKGCKYLSNNLVNFLSNGIIVLAAYLYIIII
jgi:uncharacterized protein (TIGR00297 family)